MKVKKPNAVIYLIVYIFLYPLMKILFRLEVDRKNYSPPKGPFLVISNHSSFMDFLIVMLSFFPRRLNAIAAQKFFLYKPLNRLLPMMGCIPKNLFDPDVRSIMGAMAVLKRGDRILLFPEGRCSTDGSYARMHRSTGKLIKKLGVPVISCHIDGAYTCMPFWRKGFRRGNIRLVISGLFTENDLEQLSVDDINNAVDARLSGADAPPPRKQFRTFRARRLAEGLQNVLYLCPKCGAEFSMETKGNLIRCALCGNAAEIDRAGTLAPTPESVAPKSIQDWNREQIMLEATRLTGDMEPIVEQVTVRTPALNPGDGMTESGKGELRLSPQGWHYNGTLYGENVSMFFPIGSVPALPFDPDDDFQIYSNGKFFMFTPEDSRRCAKYALLGEIAHRKFSPQDQMTPGIDSGFIF